jgi:hypothetical protein
MLITPALSDQSPPSPARRMGIANRRVALEAPLEVMSVAPVKYSTNATMKNTPAIATAILPGEERNFLHP